MSVLEQSAAREKGPLVFLDYDQAALDAAYDQSVYAPNQEQVKLRREVASKLVRSRLGDPDRLAYGPTDHEKLDIFGCGQASAPIIVFIHGGAWKNGVAHDHAFAAETFVRAGAHYVVPDFIQIDEAGGKLMTMADQVRRAIAWVHKNAKSFGGDPSRLYVFGHSSGAHLTSCAITANWAAYKMPPDIIKAAICISGMYDLKPVRLSARSKYVKFDDETEDELSAIRHLDRLKAPVIVAYGTNESPEFQRQAKEFAAAVKAAGKPVELLVGEHYNHFELPETLSNPYGPIGRAALRLLKLVPR